MIETVAVALSSGLIYGVIIVLSLRKIIYGKTLIKRTSGMITLIIRNFCKAAGIPPAEYVTLMRDQLEILEKSGYPDNELEVLRVVINNLAGK